MIDNIKKDKPPITKRLYAEPRGQYVYVDGQKIFRFEFPSDSTVIQNYDVICYLKNEIWKAMEDQRKKEEAKQKAQAPKEEEKKEVTPKP